jgi:hypothetical protein
MKPDFDVFFWKLHFSVKHLATGKGTLKNRLNEVFKSYCFIFLSILVVLKSSA